MFYQPLEQVSSSQEQCTDLEEVETRPRSNSNPTDISTTSEAITDVFQSKNKSRLNESLSKIDEKDEAESQDPRGEYKLCGYLYKIQWSSKKPPVPGLRSLGSSAKKRWFVYSDKVCKLYYYKQKNDSEPLGVIDIALATFYFDPENKNEGQFTIRSGSDDTVLEASSSQGRMYWLQQLQAARREFSQRRTATQTPASRTTSTGRPESGLLQEHKPIVLQVSDPLQDLMKPVMRPTDTEKRDSPHKNPSPLMDARLALSNLLPSQKKIFRTSSESSKSPTSPIASRASPFSSPSAEDLSFGNISRKLRSSLRGKRSSSFEGPEGLDVTPLHSTKIACRKCEELTRELKSLKEDLSATQDEYNASREVIDLLQKDLDSLHQEKCTLIQLDRSDLTDTHVLEILRSKDHHIVDLEHKNQKLTNEVAVLSEQVSSAESHHEHLTEKLSMLYSLIEAKDKAIVTLTHQLDEKVAVSRPVSLPPAFTLMTLETVTRGTQTTDIERDALKDSLEAYRCQNAYLNKEILELNLLRKQASDREQKLITESSEWEAKFYQIQSKYLLLLNELHSPRATQHDPSVVSQLLQDVVEAQGSPDLRKGIEKIIRKEECGFKRGRGCVDPVFVVRQPLTDEDLEEMTKSASEEEEEQQPEETHEEIEEPGLTLERLAAMYEHVKESNSSRKNMTIIWFVR
ncbi:hypothetical protein SK128_021334 [Halocaridina rubra]|uniref:PH domain-containing protein n=1 Tax=Halocaridina rubra TaxID=373956 RepID=A0AAN8ZY18_HALRR